MADHYIASTGSNTSPYDTWAKAASSATTGLADAITAGAAGDRYFMDKTNTISNTTAQTITLKGTVTTPDQFYSVTNTGSPSVAADISAGATFTTTGASGITISGFGYFYGFGFQAGTGTTGAAAIAIPAGGSAGMMVFESCTFSANLTTVATSINLGGGASNNAAYVKAKNCSFILKGGITSGFGNAGGTVELENCSFSTPNASLNNLIGSARIQITSLVGCDLTCIASGKSIGGGGANAGPFRFINCKITSGALWGVPTAAGVYCDFVNCDSGATGYVSGRRMYEGSQDTSITIYNAASDGVTPQSWSIATTANNSHAFSFECFEISKWVAPGTYAATVANIVSQIALTNADIWIEAWVMDQAGNPQAHKYSSGVANELTAGSALNTGATWSNPPTTPTYYKLEVPSFIVTIAGYVKFKIKVAKASITSGQLFIDPNVTVA